MSNVHQEHLLLEREFLHEMSHCLHKALFIIDRLSEELREEEGRQEDDPETLRLFSHLNHQVSAVEKMVKSRHGILSEILDEEFNLQRKIKKEMSVETSPRRSPDFESKTKGQ